MQLFEGANPFVARDRADPSRAQMIFEQHRGGFAEPLQARLVSRVLERDDENAVGDRALRGDRTDRENRRGGSHDHQKGAWHFPAKVPGTFCSLFVRHAAAAGSSAVTPLTTTDSRQPLRPPAARHSVTRASARKANCCSTRAIAEA